jgi:leucyl-tRNA synthetase
MITHDQLLESARRMRREPTLAESRLWRHLRLRQIRDRKFRRQHILMRLIVDFYCPSAKLVIEVDGPIHQSQVVQDSERDKILADLGFNVLRFANDQVENDLRNVLSQIKEKLEAA